MSENLPTSHGPVVETQDAHGHVAHGQDAHGHDAHGGHAGHSTGIAQYIYVFIALCLLTTLSFLTSFHWWHEYFSVTESRMLMMAVSCTKALLVILFFMHVLWEANWKFVLTIPAMLMSIFLLLMLVPDIGMRLRHASEERKFQAAEPPPEQASPPAAPQPAAEPAS